jgi:hypothetical protein
MRSIFVIPALLLTACAELPTNTPAPPSGPSNGEFAMIARIGDIKARATESHGFGDTVVTVGKGGFILETSFQNTGAVAHAAVTPAEYELRVSGSRDGGPLAQRVVYTPLGEFEGSFYWVAPGQKVETWIGLWHKSEEHYDAGPYRMFIERQPHSYTEVDDPPVQ